MARMIPPSMDADVRSSAERRIFGLLKTDPDTRDWTVLHSLGLARRTTGPYGEIDFVLIIPGHGIVCLEVKGGRVSCESGVWSTVNRYGKSAALGRSPFMQARESMFTLRDAITGNFGRHALESRTPIGCGVVLPDVTCPPVTPEFERTDVIDLEDLGRPISHSIRRLARRRLTEFQDRETGVRLPRPTEVRTISNFLRPDFDRVVARAVTVRRSDAKLLGLTEEQYSRLDELEDNPRCLFEGAAGTGKTLLALEYARRASRSGARVMLVCFNRLLGTWLQEQTDGIGVTAGTWHGVARRLILSSSLVYEFLQSERESMQAGDQRTLFEELYPIYVEYALEERAEQFDVLVVDEAQDLIDQRSLDSLNRALYGGIAGGRWAIFGDFTRQALYSSSDIDHVEAISQYCQHFVRAKLTLNCRNTRRIAEETTILSGFSSAPFKLGQEVGLPVEHRYWRTADDLRRSLDEVVGNLMQEGISIEDVIILSPRRLENSALAQVDSISGYPVTDRLWEGGEAPTSLPFSTLHAFKGMESQVVIVVDIDALDGIEPESNLYVAMSRARSLLILMVNQGIRKSLENRMRSAIAREIVR